MAESAAIQESNKLAKIHLAASTDIENMKLSVHMALRMRRQAAQEFLKCENEFQKGEYEKMIDYLNERIKLLMGI